VSVTGSMRTPVRTPNPGDGGWAGEGVASAIVAGINGGGVTARRRAAVAVVMNVVVTTRTVVVIRTAIGIISPVAITGANNADAGDRVIAGTVAGATVVTGRIVRAGREQEGQASA